VYSGGFFMKAILGLSLALLLLTPSYLRAQLPANPLQNQPPGAQAPSDQNPLYRININVIERNVKAMNYRVRSGSTPVDFRGTALMPAAYGEAKVESKRGYTEIEVEFDELRGASQFGPEYLTFVMWAITPEGRATNLGEVILTGDEGKLNVTTELQSFGLIVTAEPYFAVTQPSDVVVMENFMRGETRGTSEQIDAKFELLKRGQYTVNALPADLKPLPQDRNTPLDLLQARNAMRIALWNGANTSAADVYQKAQGMLTEAESLQARGRNKKDISTVARNAVQKAEDARLVALQRQAEARAAAERQAAADREARARAQAADDAARRAQAEADRALEAERRARAEAEERVAREQADKARLETERARLEADRANALALAADDRAAENADAARKAREQAERDKAELRAQLNRQLNLILETRDTARGLIVSMSDVLFDTAQHTLKPGAREKLAKISGIVVSHPGLTLKIEGHTDSVGADDYNQGLSERRADSVRSYLIQNGVPAGIITATGYGESQPVASNDTASGRQQNRRVEMVVSGDIIETTISTTLRD
jgi:outer membrane protein OmpA-like peptidoglycan-associated protein